MTCTLTLTTKHREPPLYPGDTIRLIAKLTDTFLIWTFPVKGERVNFQWRNSVTSWKSIGTVKTGSLGMTRIKFTPATADTYEFRCFTLGDKCGGSLLSTTNPVTISPLPCCTLTLTSRSPEIILGETIRLVAELKYCDPPNPVPNKTLIFYRRVNSGSWTWITSKRTGSLGKTRITFTPAKTGLFEFKCFNKTKERTCEYVEAHALVTVHPLCCNLNFGAKMLTDKIRLIVQIYDCIGTPTALRGITVTFQRLNPDNTWTTLGTAKTGLLGIARFDIPKTPGTHTFKCFTQTWPCPYKEAQTTVTI